MLAKGLEEKESQLGFKLIPNYQELQCIESIESQKVGEEGKGSREGVAYSRCPAEKFHFRKGQPSQLGLCR